MTARVPSSANGDVSGDRAPGFADLFTPKLVTVLREGYTGAHLKADAIAGLTVAIVALPLDHQFQMRLVPFRVPMTMSISSLAWCTNHRHLLGI